MRTVNTSRLHFGKPGRRTAIHSARSCSRRPTLPALPGYPAMTGTAMRLRSRLPLPPPWPWPLPNWPACWPDGPGADHRRHWSCWWHVDPIARLVLEYQAGALGLRPAPVPIHTRAQSRDQVVPRVLDRWNGNRPNLGWMCLGYGGRRDAGHRLDLDRFGGRRPARSRSERGVRYRRWLRGDGWKAPDLKVIGSTDDHRLTADWRTGGRRRARGCRWIDGQGRAGNNDREHRGQSAGL